MPAHDGTSDHGTFHDTVIRAAERLPAARLRTIAEQIADGWPDEAITWAAAGDDTRVIAAVLHARRAERVPPAVAAAYLRGAADGYAQGRDNQRVEVVFSGPTSAAVPVRATAAVLTDLIGEARRELVLVTYSARPYPPVIDALRAALLRGVTIDVVVETLAGAGTALAGAEPAAAFADLPGARLWHWPVERRPNPTAKLHAKLAIADRHTLLVSSVNLTQSGVEHSLEAGIIVRDGPAPGRAADHIRHLQAQSILQPLIT